LRLKYSQQILMLKKTLLIMGILASIATIAAHSTTAVQNVKGSKEANQGIKEVDQCGNFIEGSTIQGGSFSVNCERTKLSTK
jgi:hypothetical protein